MNVYENRLAPDVRHAESAIVWLRILSSLAWLDSAFVGKDAKLSPTFLSGVGLTKVVMEKFLHTAIFPWVADLLQNVVLPHAQLFAVLIAVTDTAIGVLLVLGLFTRLGGALAILRAMTNILIAGGAGADTVGYNWMLIVGGSHRDRHLRRQALWRGPHSDRALTVFAPVAEIGIGPHA